MTKVFSFPFTLIVSLSWAVNAQQYSISGTVGDGLAVMPGVSISLKDVLSPQARTTLARDAKTDSEGKYRFENLTAGTYRLSFSKPWFEKAERTIVLEAEPVVLNVSLVVAGISTSIEVTDVPSKAHHTDARPSFGMDPLPLALSSSASAQHDRRKSSTDLEGLQYSHHGCASTSKSRPQRSWDNRNRSVPRAHTSPGSHRPFGDSGRGGLCVRRLGRLSELRCEWFRR